MTIKSTAAKRRQCLQQTTSIHAVDEPICVSLYNIPKGKVKRVCIF